MESERRALLAAAAAICCTAASRGSGWLEDVFSRGSAPSELTGTDLLKRMRWLNPPASSRASAGRLHVVSKSRTDFWQKTRYRYSADSGHFLYLTTSGDFTLEARVFGQYRVTYDQAGLMVRRDASTWLRCGLVLVNNTGYATTVITRNFSDWSAVPGIPANQPLWWRVVRNGQSLEVLYSADGRAFGSIRVGYLPLPAVVELGVMCASPEGEGFPCTFDCLRLAPLSVPDAADSN